MGDWGPFKRCPAEQHVKGIQLRIEGQQGGGDDTALNAIRLYCSGGSSLISKEGPWGSWLTTKFLSGTHKFTAASIRQEKSQGGGDDTGGNGIMLYSRTSNTVIKPGDGYWGDWASWQHCPTGSWIVGFQTKVERNQGGGDDTALNEVKFYCSNK